MAVCHFSKSYETRLHGDFAYLLGLSLEKINRPTQISVVTQDPGRQAYRSHWYLGHVCDPCKTATNCTAPPFHARDLERPSYT